MEFVSDSVATEPATSSFVIEQGEAAGEAVTRAGVEAGTAACCSSMLLYGCGV